MFHTVRLQPGDSAKELAALGLKLKRKNKQPYFLQPCPAFRESHCAIYKQRPERCRVFECRQLRQAATGEITEEAALEKIREVRRRAECVDGLLQRAGGTNRKRPLAARCEAILAEPRDIGSDKDRDQLRDELAEAMQELEAMLETCFRIDSSSISTRCTTPTPLRG